MFSLSENPGRRPGLHLPRSRAYPVGHRWMRVCSLLALAGILSGFGSGCTSDTAGAEREVRAVVAKYNRALKRVYLEANIDFLRGLATSEQIAKVYPVVLALREQQSSMIALQDMATVLSVRIEKDTATVRTEEKWTHWWQHIRTARITRDRQETSYRLDYLLVRKNGAWMINEIRSVT